MKAKEIIWTELPIKRNVDGTIYVSDCNRFIIRQQDDHINFVYKDTTMSNVEMKVVDSHKKAGCFTSLEIAKDWCQEKRQKRLYKALKFIEQGDNAFMPMVNSLAQAAMENCQYINDSAEKSGILTALAYIKKLTS